MDLHFTSLWNRGLRQLRNITGNSPSTPAPPQCRSASLVPLAAPSVLSFSTDLCRRWRSFEPYPNEHELVKQAWETKRKYCSATHQLLPFKELHEPWHFRGNISHRKKPNKSSEKRKKKQRGKRSKSIRKERRNGRKCHFCNPETKFVFCAGESNFGSWYLAAATESSI